MTSIITAAVALASVIGAYFYGRESGKRSVLVSWQQDQLKAEREFIAAQKKWDLEKTTLRKMYEKAIKDVPGTPAAADLSRLLSTYFTSEEGSPSD